MSSSRFAMLLLVVSAPYAVSAQTPIPDPAQPEHPVHSYEYHSSFADYRPANSNDGDTLPTANWRGANDEVRALGGHAGHIRDAATVSGPNADGQPADAHMRHHAHHNHQTPPQPPAAQPQVEHQH